MNIHLTDGRFRIIHLEYDNPQYGDCYIEHDCSIYVQRGHWTGLVYTASNSGYHCSWCKESAPDGLQACFIFLKDHFGSNNT